MKGKLWLGLQTCIYIGVARNMCFKKEQTILINMQNIQCWKYQVFYLGLYFSAVCLHFYYGAHASQCVTLPILYYSTVAFTCLNTI